MYILLKLIYTFESKEGYILEPTIQKTRIEVIDLLRGFALIGLPFVNVIGLWMGRLNLSGTETDIFVQRFLYIFIEGRFYAIFSFLFGLGIWIFLSKAKEKTAKPYRLFLRRMLLLGIIGAIHQVFQPGEALLIYALISFIVLFFDKLPKQLNLSLGIIGVIVGSLLAVKLLLPIPLMILGLAFGQYRIFEKVNENRKIWIGVMFISFLITCFLVVYLWQEAPAQGSAAFIGDVEETEAQIQSNMQFYEFVKLYMTVSPFFSVFYVSFLVVIEPLMRNLLVAINALGRMAFTNYIGQTVFLLLFMQMALSRKIASYEMAVIVCAVIIIFQMFISLVWLKMFKYGPLEWLWRCGTYGKWLSIKK